MVLGIDVKTHPKTTSKKHLFPLQAFVQTAAGHGSRAWQWPAVISFQMCLDEQLNKEKNTIVAILCCLFYDENQTSCLDL